MDDEQLHIGHLHDEGGNAVSEPDGGKLFERSERDGDGGNDGASLHYTLDGTVPTEVSPSVASGSAVAVNQSGTLTRSIV